MAKSRGEKGQAVPLLVVALSIVLIGGMGLAVDAANLYQQNQRAQVAADAAATAAAMSIFQGTNTSASNPAKFTLTTSTSITCNASSTELPCAYARLNGFGAINADSVNVDAPVCGGTPNPCAGFDGNLANRFTPDVVRVTITRDTNNTIMKMLGAANTTRIKAVGVAAIVEIKTPVPIIITHPSYPSTLYLNGVNNATVGIQICGGPSRSVQVNSSNPSAFNPTGGTVDLRYAGPSTTYDQSCTTHDGADFSVLGGVTTKPSEVQLGGAGQYIHSGPIPDPFIDVVENGYAGSTADGSPPQVPLNVAATPTHVLYGTGSCTNPGAGAGGNPGCYLFHPGLYKSPTWPNGLKPHDFGSGATTYALFEPGLYYVQSTAGVDFTHTAGGNMTDYNGNALADSVMCTTPPPAPNNTMCGDDQYTKKGMLIYNTGPSARPTAAGAFNVGTGAQVVFTGPTITQSDGASPAHMVPAPPYYNIVFWQDRNSVAHTGNSAHVLGTGNGCFTFNGATLYITNTLEIMQADPTHYQAVKYAGTPCSNTVNTGDIIVGTLEIKGNSIITMSLVPFAFVHQDKIALVAGGSQKPQ